MSAIRTQEICHSRALRRRARAAMQLPRRARCEGRLTDGFVTEPSPHQLRATTAERPYLDGLSPRERAKHLIRHGRDPAPYLDVLFVFRSPGLWPASTLFLARHVAPRVRSRSEPSSDAWICHVSPYRRAAERPFDTRGRQKLRGGRSNHRRHPRDAASRARCLIACAKRVFGTAWQSLTQHFIGNASKKNSLPPMCATMALDAAISGQPAVCWNAPTAAAKTAVSR